MSELVFTNWQEIERRVVERRSGGLVCVDDPRVSVVIPCYNSARLIAETLETVFAQTFPDFEVIVVNDGSPDTADLEAALAPFSEHIVYLRQENGGASAARNTGIYFARGALVAFLDGDDLWLPEYLAAQTKFIEANDFQMIYCDALLFGEKLWEGRRYMESSPSRGAVSVESLLLGECNVITSGTMIEKEQLVLREGFDESAAAMRVEDFDLWIGLAKQGCRIGYQRTVLLKYRAGASGLSGGNVSRAERTVQAFKLVKEKNDFTESELVAWAFQLKRAEAELELERGKFYLVRENFEQSLFHFSEANKFFRKKKLLFIIWLIKNRPALVLSVYRKFRADEFEFVRRAAAGK